MQGPPVFTISKLNDSTHLIIQNDKYLEFPYIYVKQYKDRQLFVVIDTGCGAHNGKDGSPKVELKDFIEDQLCKEPTRDETLEYIVICTHCHFDHIGGIEKFATSNATIFASGYDKAFLNPKDRAANSLCEAFSTATPSYEVTRYLEHGEKLYHHDFDLGLQALHTPGHTPDSLAIYDDEEGWLFTGDTVYRRVATMPWEERQDVPIVMPLQGNWRDFIASIGELLAFVQRQQSHATQERRIRIAAGHTTCDGFALDVLENALEFVRRVEEDKVPVIAKLPGDQVAPGGSLGDAEFWFWQDEGEPEFSLIAPESMRKDFGCENS